MEPWVAIVLTGAAIAGYGWLLPAGNAKAEAAADSSANEEAYDRLLEDLETENRELVDAVVQFKQEQDATVDRLGRRIRELERQMSEWKPSSPVEQSASAAAAEDRQGAAAFADRESAASSAPAAVSPGVAAAAAVPAAEAAVREPAAAVAAPAADQPSEAAAGRLPSVEPAGAAPSTIRGRYAELIALYERGRSIEQIAKMLHLNKGEVQLILQLAKREVGQRA
jgi:hypothetical protein